MSLRIRIILSFLLIVGIGFYFLIDWIIEDLRPHYLEAVEESIVDQSQFLASLLEAQSSEVKIQTSVLNEALRNLSEKTYKAKIYRLLKTRTDIRVYVTDSKGIVIFDSNEGKDFGKNYSHWNDVALTLKGKYGARTSHPQDMPEPKSSVMYVAAPIKINGKIAGVVSVGKPTANINFFFENAQPKIRLAGAIAALSVIILGISFSSWITSPIRKLKDYAQAIQQGKKSAFPILGKHEIGELGIAFEKMREALEGKKYVEHYLQTLTHEIKSPLSTIRGAAELLEEEMPQEQQQQFIQNIQSESERIQKLIDRMLELAALENRKSLDQSEKVDLTLLLAELKERLRPLCLARKISIEFDSDRSVFVTKADPFLLSQAFSNLLHNAIEFSPEGGKIRIELREDETGQQIRIEDEGAGIPTYAKPHLFEKFYSLPRPTTGKKSTGVGLSFVKQVAELHQARVSVENREEGGVRATFRFD